jgi:hypothetical protein
MIAVRHISSRARLVNRPSLFSRAAVPWVQRRSCITRRQGFFHDQSRADFHGLSAAASFNELADTAIPRQRRNIRRYTIRLGILRVTLEPARRVLNLQIKFIP